nr:potassium channel family protein [Microbacterium invictum]
MVIASLAFLIAYSWRVIADLSGLARDVTTWILAVTWLLFICDYVVRLALARFRGAWFRRHLGALTFAVLPTLRLVLLLRVLTRIPGMRLSAGAALRTRIVVYGTGVAIVLIYLASLTVLDAERHAPGATIVTFGDAIWWSCVTVTTTGYGDLVPATDEGRLVGTGLMFVGVALSGVITATLASWIVERASRGGDDAEPATRGQVRELIAKVDALGEPVTGSERTEDPTTTPD